MKIIRSRERIKCKTGRCRYIEPAVGKCDCGGLVSLEGFTNACSCGRLYNMSGQELSDPRFWGEETGEHPADILRIP